VNSIRKLPSNRAYNYVEPATTTRLQIVDAVLPGGPIKLKRYDPNKGTGPDSGKVVNISANMIARVANAIHPGQPINIDRILGASYNTRSALEALLAHTPEFYVCHPGRIETNQSTTAIKSGHKHLMWNPDKPHEQGVVREVKTDIVISEMPGVDAVYEALELPSGVAHEGLDIDIVRRHAQIQVALVLIGRQLGFRTWVARNDKAIVYNNRKLGETQGVVVDLGDEALIAPHQGAVGAALFIDCIWFRNTRFMPAVIEIEHTTGITSGLDRMKNLYDRIPPFPTRWVIAAPDEDRNAVMEEANKPMFEPMKPKFFAYSAIEELYSLCQRRNLTRESVNEAFLDSFMESCLPALPN
jgi:type II restriction enzyme